jgi:hypothetical protein
MEKGNENSAVEKEIIRHIDEFLPNSLADLDVGSFSENTNHRNEEDYRQCENPIHLREQAK